VKLCDGPTEGQLIIRLAIELDAIQWLCVQVAHAVSAEQQHKKHTMQDNLLFCTLITIAAPGAAHRQFLA
jgi:hypothetical protein